ncbi:hypothetical protein CPC08DRAFT_709328 [Agrocybe pediades]|nr:hypothetical protein CPC08DRAFT_709328 [Agrocybe pediades]
MLDGLIGSTSRYLDARVSSGSSCLSAARSLPQSAHPSFGKDSRKKLELESRLGIVAV